MTTGRDAEAIGSSLLSILIGVSRSDPRFGQGQRVCANPCLGTDTTENVESPRHAKKAGGVERPVCDGPRRATSWTSTWLLPIVDGSPPSTSRNGSFCRRRPGHVALSLSLGRQRRSDLLDPFVGSPVMYLSQTLHGIVEASAPPSEWPR
jgi:hypothetical protein